MARPRPEWASALSTSLLCRPARPLALRACPMSPRDSAVRQALRGSPFAPCDSSEYLMALMLERKCVAMNSFIAD